MIRLILGLLALALPITAAEPGRFFVFRSDDRGRTWARSDAGLPGHARINALTAGSEAIIAGTDSGIFFSTDSARTWQKSAMNGVDPVRVAALTVSDGYAFAATDRREILTSTNSGRAWRNCESYPRHIVRSLATVDRIVYVGTDGGGVFMTPDFGNRWNQVGAGLPPNSQIFSLVAVDGEIFAALYANGLYSLDRKTQQWTSVGAEYRIKPLALAAVGKTLIAGHNPGGIYVTNDRGRTWTPWSGDSRSGLAPFHGLATFHSLSLNAPIWELAANDHIAFAGAADGIFFSEDAGIHWTRATVGLPEVCPGVAFLVQSNFVLAATLNNYKTRNSAVQR